ncbi:hypothetical protein PR048_023686 [Dryococelus australis]|uniref:Uncharacterized protein n=1 Tax=Dryococelus australis TaxID=614101 RepID=A0ABQ9GUU1_9NEOP|nr:hypothetical protein PR048_023686 [Dryococelus australis]
MKDRCEDAEASRDDPSYSASAMSSVTPKLMVSTAVPSSSSGVVPAVLTASSNGIPIVASPLNRPLRLRRNFSARVTSLSLTDVEECKLRFTEEHVEFLQQDNTQNTEGVFACAIKRSCLLLLAEKTEKYMSAICDNTAALTRSRFSCVRTDFTLPPGFLSTDAVVQNIAGLQNASLMADLLVEWLEADQGFDVWSINSVVGRSSAAMRCFRLPEALRVSEVETISIHFHMRTSGGTHGTYAVFQLYPHTTKHAIVNIGYDIGHSGLQTTTTIHRCSVHLIFDNREISKGVMSGDLGGQATDPPLPLQRVGNIWLRTYFISKAQYPVGKRRLTSGKIPTCENPGVTRPATEPGSLWWEASRLVAQPPWPLKKAECSITLQNDHHSVDIQKSWEDTPVVRDWLAGITWSSRPAALILADQQARPADVRRGARLTHPRRSESKSSQTANIFSTSCSTVGLTFVRCAGIAVTLHKAAYMTIDSSWERSTGNSKLGDQLGMVRMPPKTWRFVTLFPLDLPTTLPQLGEQVPCQRQIFSHQVDIKKGINEATKHRKATTRIMDKPQQDIVSLGQEPAKVKNKSMKSLVMKNTHLHPNSAEFRSRHYTGRHVVFTWLSLIPNPTIGGSHACSPPTKTNLVQSPTGSLPNFCMWESCWAMPLIGGFSRWSPISSVPSFRRCSILT